MEFNPSAAALALRTGNQRVQMMSGAQAAMLDGWIRGNWRTAIPVADRAYEMAVQAGSTRFQSMAMYIRALLDIRAGEMTAAQARLDHALELCGEGSMLFLGPQIYGTLARVQTDPALLAELQRLRAVSEAASGSLYLADIDRALQRLASS